MVTVTIDAKGRLSIPAEIRGALDIQAGDVFFVESDIGRQVIHLAKAKNPFDGLAEHAIQEYRLGSTRNLRAFAADLEIDVDDE